MQITLLGTLTKALIETPALLCVASIACSVTIASAPHGAWINDDPNTAATAATDCMFLSNPKIDGVCANYGRMGT